MKRLSFYIAILALLISCNSNNENSLPQNEIIVFFNIKEYSRGQISNYINRIDSLDPKLICISALFDSLNDPIEDSLLARSIKDSKKVILAAYADTETGNLIRSHLNFTINAINEGVINYLIDDNGLTVSHIPLYQDSKMQMISYPNEIAFAYRVTENNRITKFNINEEVDIEFNKGFDDFVVLDERNIEPDLVKDKIVLFGNLGPEHMDTQIIKVNGRKIEVPPEVVTANVILNILSEN